MRTKARELAEIPTVIAVITLVTAGAVWLLIVLTERM